MASLGGSGLERISSTTVLACFAAWQRKVEHKVENFLLPNLQNDINRPDL